MSRFAIRSNLAALAMVAASGGLLAGTVMAAPPADGGPAAMHEGRHGGGFHKGMRDGLWIPGLGPVSKAQVDQLKLDDKQQALLKTAQDGQRGLRDAMRTSGGQRHDLLKAQLDAGKLDPHALVDQTDKSREQFGSQAKQVRDQWLAVWDSLNDAQRAQVTQLVKERQAKMQERHAKMEGRHGKGPANAPGAVPPPPPAPPAAN
ncbi:hypothetical protein LMG3458_04153 [Achromobacter deleyi]|uniref:Periplasmic heavy metal sensor n=1 Tax=Achromobacter deleyi TaxID=1353891 RepID=A0A6S7BPD5_9BURK|nr:MULTISPECIES: periplasmic heavy metal sensor [Achromobacter]CAB3723196.1 hypothetical protein LMG3458_04153 [Achromobacter deleyi]CAB3899970.1 hypothetical protein LMG3482_04251 [Achromobacter deleyi]CAB3925808.1 hypothetical protein LMG3412_05772 [Achromobacter deleyi]CAB3926175.1 hypothetical protein LMG3481_05864 [Achromobacter deleyi]